MDVEKCPDKVTDTPYMMENTPEEYKRVRDLTWPALESWERYVKWLQDGRPELKTADEWSAIKGIIIRDPDGWRTDDAPAWDQPITEAEFTDRSAGCTIQLLPGRTCG